MEASSEQGLDSPSRNSYIGSYYQPPDTIIRVPRRLDFPFHSIADSDLSTTSHRGSKSKSSIDSKAVVDALKMLQEKINRVEAETSRHSEKSLKMCQEPQTNLQNTASTKPPAAHCQQPTKEYDAMIRCKTLQKQLEKTKKFIEQAKKEQSTILENQTSVQKEQLNTSVQLQNLQLEKLQSKYETLSRTQTQSEVKLALLEEKLQKEEHERKLVQEKAEELQREFDSTLRKSTDEIKVKKKTKKTSRRSEQKSPIRSFNQKMPFVAGMSTSPSHSVHANVQSLLHLMKLHQPQLHRSLTRRGLTRDFCSSARHRPHSDPSDPQALGSLSDLLLALQDELGLMSFEQQELMLKVDAALDLKKRQDLKDELEHLVSRMEEKGAQISTLRKHQHTIHKMAKEQHQTENVRPVQPPPPPSPVKPQRRPQRRTPGRPRSSLQLLRETQQFRSSLQQSDLVWET